jgi:anti-sigma-K factor RskA
MSAPTHSDQDLSRREELSISGAAMSGAPWGAAVATGGVVAAGDFALHVLGSGLSGFHLSALSGSLAMGAVAFFVVAAAGALWRAKPSRAIRWARSNPWRFAIVPAIACAAIALVLSVVTGGGIIHGALSGLWHGGLVYGLTGVAAVASKSRKPAA